MKLDISNTTLKELEGVDFAQGQKPVTQLNLSAVQGLSDSSCSSILKKCKKLLYLDLSFCMDITDKAFFNIHEPFLKILNLKGCEELTDKSLYYIARGCGCLQVLLLAFAGNITDEGLMHFQGSTTLKKLDLSRCSNITEKGVDYLVKISPALQILNLLGTKIPNQFVEDLNIQRPNLVVLF